MERAGKMLLLAAFVVMIAVGSVWVSNTVTKVDNIDGLIHKEQICTRTNEAACQSLFDRLAVNLTREQRVRLGCDVMASLDTPESQHIRRTARCPRPIPPAPPTHP